MVWLTSPGAMACSRRVSCSLDTPAGLEASSIHPASWIGTTVGLTNVVPTVLLADTLLKRLRAAAAQQLCSTNPHEPPCASLPALVQCPATRGFVVGVVAGIPRWHARGQGFKSPQLQEWLDCRGLPPYDPQQAGNRKQADLTRLTQARGTAFDLAFLKVMTARHRAGIKLAATKARTGSLPEIRQLAQQLLIEQRGQVAKMTAWKRAWSKPNARPPDARAAGHR
jgi:hypothetical protein